MYVVDGVGGVVIQVEGWCEQVYVYGEDDDYGVMYFMYVDGFGYWEQQWCEQYYGGDVF